MTGRDHDHERPDREPDRGYQEIDPGTWNNIRDALLQRDRLAEYREQRREVKRAARARRRAEKRREEGGDDQAR